MSKHNMNEINVDKYFILSQVRSLKSAVEGINASNYDIYFGRVNTLKASMKYIKQHKQIAKLMNLYKSLVVKDALDLQKMQEALTFIDYAIAESIGNNENN